MLAWWKLSSSTAYPWPSINSLNHRHCGKESYDPTIYASVDILPFIFYSVISPLLTLIPWTSLFHCDPCILGIRQRTHQPSIRWHSGCWTLLLAADSGYFWGIWLPWQAFPDHPSSLSLLRYIVKQCPFLISFLELDVTNIICATICWSAFYRSSFSIVHLSLGLTWNILLSTGIFLLPVMTSSKSSITPFR